MGENNLKRKWEVLLIHHTHTDIGYTESQETIEHYHVNFIKQAIEIAEDLRSKGKEDEFTWVCESFWGVQCFLRGVDESWRKRFKEAVQNKSIEITGNYLNFTELVDYDLLKNQTKKAVDFGKSIGVDIKSAMTADINGYSWGYGDGLYESGIRNLFSCVHSHHGMYPLFRKQKAFYWNTAKGNKLLVWNGEHYHFGNEFGIVNTATGSYINQDELAGSFTRDKVKEYGKIRMFRFLKSLEDQNYEYNFVPITVHGLPTDNGSPNIEVMEFANWWNENFGEEVTVKVSSLENFFDKLKASEVPIETYSGDWPDWWSFGVGSTPQVLKIYKEAQRLLKVTKLIDEKSKYSNDNLVEQCEEMLLTYAEHTWGHSSSVTNPWNSFVNLLDYKKSGYAIRAHEMAIRNYNRVLEEKGMSSLKPNREPKFKIINPHNRRVKESVKLSLDYWENSNLKDILVDQYGNSYEIQKEPHPRGTYINAILELEPKEERVFWIESNENPINYIKIKNESKAVDGIEDIYLYENSREMIKYGNVYENNNVKISWNREKGIIGWFDKINGVELFDSSSEVGAFMPIYELTKAENQSTNSQYSIRAVGRNMRGKNHKVFYPTINAVEVTEIGEVYGKINFDLELKGTSLLKLVLKVYNKINKVDVSVIMNKDSVWDPESIFVALPFALNDKKMDLFAEKTGCTMQIKKEQLLGTNCDYNLVQNGIGLKEGNYGISIAMPDTSLIYTSALMYENAKKLFHKDYTNSKDYKLYSWPMNNIWETNFKASLAGFIEFNYSISWFNSTK
ncbi:MAG: hypothetical protein ACRDD2_01140, partial [Sarcina sp.]